MCERYRHAPHIDGVNPQCEDLPLGADLRVNKHMPPTQTR